MKTLVAFAFLVSLSSAPALAADGKVSHSSLAKMGLSGMKQMTDRQGRRFGVGLSSLPRTPSSGACYSHRFPASRGLDAKAESFHMVCFFRKPVAVWRLNLHPGGSTPCPDGSDGNVATR